MTYRVEAGWRGSSRTPIDRDDMYSAIRRRVAAGAAAAAIVTVGCASTTTVGPSPLPFPQPANRPTAPDATPPRPMPAAVVDAVLDTARALEGRPYRFGGSDPVTGFDCSGLVWYVFTAHAVDVPRTTEAQYRIGAPIAPVDIAAGDLVFFATTAPGPSHVGIALDARTLIHAPSTGSTVRIERFDTAYWLSRLTGVRRIERPPPG